MLYLKNVLSGKSLLYLVINLAQILKKNGKTEAGLKRFKVKSKYALAD